MTSPILDTLLKMLIGPISTKSGKGEIVFYSKSPYTVVPLYPREMHPKFPSGYLKPQVVPNPEATVSFPTHTSSLCSSQLLPAYLNCQHHDPRTLGPSLSKIRVTWTEALWYHDMWYQHGYLELWRCWTKAWFMSQADRAGQHDISSHCSEQHAI